MSHQEVKFKESVQKFAHDIRMAEPGFAKDVERKDIFYAMKEYIQRQEGKVFAIALFFSVFCVVFSIWNFISKNILAGSVFAVLTGVAIAMYVIVMRIMRKRYIHTGSGNGYFVPTFLANKIMSFLNSMGKKSSINFLIEYHSHNLFALPYSAFVKQKNWLEAYFDLPENERSVSVEGFSFITTMLLCIEQQMYKEASSGYELNNNSQQIIKNMHKYIEREGFSKSM